MTRREIRENCFKMLFCQDFYPAQEKEEQLERYFEALPEDETDGEGRNVILHQVGMSDAERAYLERRAEQVMEKIPEIDETIKAGARGWKLERIGKVELAVLRLALFEVLFDEEIPERVALNEGVELAKKFGGSDSGSFVNGILGKIMKDRAAASSQEKPEAAGQAEPVKEERTADDTQ